MAIETLDNFINNGFRWDGGFYYQSKGRFYVKYAKAHRISKAIYLFKAARAHDCYIMTL